MFTIDNINVAMTFNMGSILAPKYILSQVRSCNLLGRPAGQGSNKLLNQTEICRFPSRYLLG